MEKTSDRQELRERIIGAATQPYLAFVAYAFLSEALEVVED